jgi:hypothetical protein
MYRMCDLTKVVPDGTLLIQNTWIRSEIAIVGAVLKNLRDADTGVIRDGWTVASVSKEERPESYLMARVHGYDDLSKKCDH